MVREAVGPDPRAPRPTNMCIPSITLWGMLAPPSLAVLASLRPPLPRGDPGRPPSLQDQGEG